MLKIFSPLLTKDEAEFLLNITQIIPERGVILEIGSYRGGSAFLLAKGSVNHNKGKVYTIDPDIDNFESLEENIKKTRMKDRIIPITKTSEHAAKGWKKPISLLFIDGNHDYRYVKKDFILWERHLINGGIVMLHDATDSKHSILFKKTRHVFYEGPRKVAKECLDNSSRFKNKSTFETIVYAEKIRGADCFEKIKDKINLAYLDFLKIKYLGVILHRYIGAVGSFLKNKSPKVYYQLKKLKCT